MRKLLLGLTAFLLFTGTLLAQKTITGTVYDDKGNPVPSASVTIKGTTLGTTTKENGTFSLSVPANATTLVFSAVNMTEQEVVIGDRTAITVALVSSSVQDLSEVVVTVPYGTIKKTAFTGAEATVTAKQLDKQQVTSVTKALDGLVPGVMSTNGGGAPGSGAAIMIRGFSSINGSSDPLYVLNGVVYDGSINALNMDDIESVTVLKDAAAIALYGARAAGGVVMMTTKSGKKGKATVDISVRESFLNRGIPEYDRLDTKDYYEMMWEATRNSFQYASGQSAAVAGQNASAQLTDANHLVYNAYNVAGNTLVDPTTGKLNPSAQLLWNESWSDALFRTAMRTNATVSVGAATERSSYRLSMGYLNEEGIMKYTDYKRYNFRLDVRTQPGNWINLGMTIDGGYTQNNGVIGSGSFTSNPFYYSRNMGPIYPVYQHNKTTGAIILDSITKQPALDWGIPTQMGARPYAANSNLVGSLELDERSSENFNGNANTFVEVKFLKNFSFKSTLGINLYDQNATTYQNNQFGDAQNVQGRSTKSSFRQISITLNEVLSYSRAFGMHNVRALVGHENYKYQDKSLSATRIGFQFPGYTDIINATTTEGSPSSDQQYHRIESYFAQVNYDYDQKYLLSASYRRDGTSRFAPDKRWGDFYGGGLGWRVSQENFLKNVRWLNELKLRTSYGEVGQEIIGSFYNYTQYYFPDGFGNYQPSTRLANPNLIWETNKKFNIGADFMLFSNRLQGTIEWFNNVSEDLLFEVPLPVSGGPAGFQSSLQNIGANKNTGIEVQLGYTAVRGKNFNWRIDVNVTHIKNEITKLPPVQAEKGIVVGNKKWTVGSSIYDFWLREFAGVDASTGDAMFYKDVLGTDGKPTGQRVLTNDLTTASYYYKGSAIPKFNGGLTNSFNYKNFDLSILLTFAYGNKFYDGNYAGLMHAGDYGSAWHADILNRWQKPGDVTNVPRVQNAVGAPQVGGSTRFLFDGSYLNIKNINLSYTFPKTILSKAGISGTQIFASIDNAYLFTAKQGMDPQFSFTGNSDASYTPYRTFTIGLTLNL